MEQKSESHASYLRSHGIKSTASRNLIFDLLALRQEMMTAEDIFLALKDSGRSINFSTVYRTLELFTERGIVEKSNFPGSGRTVFSVCCQGHTHHLICLRCKKTVDISQCPLAEFEQRVAAETGFTIAGHNLELYGYCAECKKIMDEEK